MMQGYTSTLSVADEPQEPSQYTLGQYLLRYEVLYQAKNSAWVAETPFNNTKQGPALLLRGPSSTACQGQAKHANMTSSIVKR